MNPHKQRKTVIKDEETKIRVQLQSQSLLATIETPFLLLTALFRQELATSYEQLFEQPRGSLYSQISKYSESQLKEIIDVDDRNILICVAQLENTDKKAYIRSPFSSRPNHRFYEQDSKIQKRLATIEEKQLRDRVNIDRLDRDLQNQQSKHEALKEYIDSKLDELNKKIAILSTKWEESSPV